MLNKFVKDMAKYSPSQFLPGLTAFITTPILTRLFPPTEYGYWALALSISSLLVALTASGFGSAVIRFYPVYESKSILNVFFATLGGTIGAVTTVIAGVTFLILFLLKELLPSELVQLLPLVFLNFVTQSIFTVFLSVLRAKGHSGSFTSFQLFVNYGGLGVGLLLVWVLGFRIEGLLWGTFIILVLTLPFLISLTLRGVGVHPQHFHFPDALQMWQYAWPLALGNVAMWGLRVSDLWIISSFRSERDVGLYSVSYNISAKSIELLVTLFLLSVSPLVFSTWESKGKEATEKTLTMITRVYLIFCLPAAVGLSVLAFPFVALLTAPAYYEGYKIVGFVVFSSFAWGLSHIAMMGIAIKKQAFRLGANQIVAAIIHIGLQLLLVPRFGYVASAIATLIGYTALFVLQALASRTHLIWQFPFSTLRNVIVASIVMSLVARGIYGLSGEWSKGSPVYLFLSIVAAVTTYILCVWWLGEVREEEKRAVLQLWYGAIGKKHTQGRTPALRTKSKMKSIAQSLQESLKSALQYLGLYKYALQIRGFLDPKRRKDPSLKRFTASLNGVTVQFSTEDEYSNSWFFPRYAGGRIHEKKVTEMLVETLQGAKCFIDVGTNLGWYTCLASKHMLYGSVYGFEMDDLNFALLKKNVAINNCSNVEVHNLAVSDSPGVVSYRREGNHPSPTFYFQTGAKNENSPGFVLVNSVALDDFLESRGVVPDVIKIDVEGAEMSVLIGMKRILRDCKPKLFLEIHPSNLLNFHTSTSAILSLLIENNYSVFEIESMRNQESKKQLKPLLRDSMIVDNTMLYATVTEEKDPNVA